VPEEYGGVGLDFFTSGLICQAMGRWNYALALSWIAHENLCLNNIYRNANDDLRRKYLPDLCSGRATGALGLTEPGAGSDALGSMRTTAKRDGGHYILNGRKIYITSGPVADTLLVYAKTAPERGAHGISAFIVQRDFPGFSVAQKLVKMGFRGSQTGELVFDNCKVPVENLVGRENEGVAVVMSGLAAFTDKTITFTHFLFEVETGTLAACAEAVGMKFDQKIRKIMTFPPEDRARMEARRRTDCLSGGSQCPVSRRTSPLLRSSAPAMPGRPGMSEACHRSRACLAVRSARPPACCPISTAARASRSVKARPSPPPSCRCS